MLRICGTENSILVIGSSNNAFSLRHFFTYEERRSFILSVFPQIRLVGLPDYYSDRAWLMALDDLLRLAGVDPEQALYFGGSEEDVRFFLEDSRECHIVQRFEGPHADVSATRVRDCLIHERKEELGQLLIPKSATLIETNFSRKWEEFKKL
jgi:nicotinamide mononucleotide adenylyltransferase